MRVERMHRRDLAALPLRPGGAPGFVNEFEADRAAPERPGASRILDG